MHNKEKQPKRNSPMNKKNEKPKDFKAAIARLFRELTSFKIVILIALILAITGSILSIVAPNRLKDLTNEISKGLVINEKNIKKLTIEIKNNFNEEKLKLRTNEILSINLTEKNIYEVYSSDKLTAQDKLLFKEVLSNPSKINQLPYSILNMLIDDTTYNGVLITKKDKIEFLKNMNSMNSNSNVKVPKSISKVLLDEIKIGNTKISSADQIAFIKTFGSINKKEKEPAKIYKKIDKMPNSIKKVIEPKMNMNKIKQITMFLFILYLLSALATYIEHIIMTIVANKFARSLRANISSKINKLPLKYFDKSSIGDILSRITNDIDTIAQTMNQSLATLVSSLTLFLGTTIMMFYTNYIMALTAIAASMIGFIAMGAILKNSQKYFSARQKELGRLNGHIEEVYSGINVIKVYNGKEEALQKFDKYNKKVYEANRKSQFLSGLMMPMMMFIGNFGYVAVCIVGALLVVNDNISFGVIVAFMVYVRLFTNPLSQIAQAFTSMQSAAAASERVFNILDEEEMQKENGKIKLNKKKVKGEIEFSNVSFRYDGAKKDTIKNFTAKVKPGEKVAIVGPTGAGKTTMVNLLMKFYDINSGDIKIDGVSTKDLTRENIHSLFTMVLQDTWLFEGTVTENIAYNRKNTSKEKVKEVCKTIGLDHFIKTLPKGYNTVIGNNDSISSGQKQLMTIARGMIEEAPFLILDEATSNVDTRTEELVQIAMDKLTEGRTSFIIAHRLSTIKNADLILVMKDGNIIESGNHDQLIEKQGFYADLYNSQFEL